MSDEELYTHVLPELVERDGEMKPNPLVGSVVMALPDADVQSKLLRRMQFKIGAGGQVEIKSSDEVLQMSEEAMKTFAEWVRVIDVKIRKTGQELKTAKALARYTQGKALMGELAQVVYQGIDLGKD